MGMLDWTQFPATPLHGFGQDVYKDPNQIQGFSFFLPSSDIQDKMTFAVSAMTGLEQPVKPNRRARSSLGNSTDEEPVHMAIEGSPKKRKRTRKVLSDRKFECTHEGCGKSYSRAEHLYRHQLNHTPKQIYRCDFPDCYRSFVRQDLCVRHRERHTTRGSQLQKRDSFAQAASQNPVQRQISPNTIDSCGEQNVTKSPSSNFLSSNVDTLASQSAGGAGQHTLASSSPSVSARPFNFQPLLSQHGVETPGSTYSRSSTNHTMNSPAGQSSAAYSPSDLPRASYVSLNGRNSTNGSISSGELGQDPHSHHQQISTAMNGSAMVHPAPYSSQPGMQIPVSAYSDISMVAASNPMAPAPTVGDQGFDPLSSYPMFGGETYNRSPFAMADDFTAWLFNDPVATTSSMGYPPTAAMMSGFLDPTQVQNQLLIGEPAYGNLMNNVPHHPMSVTSLLDPGSPQAIMSEEKRQELLQLMATRFNEAAYSASAKRKDALMEGDIDDDSHVLSLRMMQMYIGSYWYHFHGQLPILHQPTFEADKAPNLLLLAVMAIGASTLDNIHGSEVTEEASELANFIAWHLRWELFMDGDFRPPAKVWIFQALLLLEVHEKMYSTRALHERAHIHHDTTLTLMRRGSSLIGRSAFDYSPASMRDERARSTTGSTSNSEYVVDESWANWIESESTRRVAFAAFVLDSTHATMFGHSAKMVAHELRLPLPCDEALWSATSAGEVARVQSSLHSNGIKPTMFLDGLKRTLNGQTVRTNAFGRTILMAGLLSVSWHMNQRDLQVSSLGVPQALGGRDKWRSSLLRSFDNWRRDFDEALEQSAALSYPNIYRTQHPLEEDNVFESRDVLHALAHMASHVDIVDCQIFAGAKRLMGRSITPRDYNTAREKMTDRWATKASARDATFYALKFLSGCLLTDVPQSEGVYSARNDTLVNRPWVLYVAALVVWCYGFALDGPLSSPVELTTAADQRRDMEGFLRRVGGAREPNELEKMKGRNQCLGLLMTLRNGFANTRWELLEEAVNMLDSCIDKLKGRSQSA